MKVHSTTEFHSFAFNLLNARMRVCDRANVPWLRKGSCCVDLLSLSPFLPFSVCIDSFAWMVPQMENHYHTPQFFQHSSSRKLIPIRQVKLVFHLMNLWNYRSTWMEKRRTINICSFDINEIYKTHTHTQQTHCHMNLCLENWLE